MKRGLTFKARVCTVDLDGRALPMQQRARALCQLCAATSGMFQKCTGGRRTRLLFVKVALGISSWKMPAPPTMGKAAQMPPPASQDVAEGVQSWTTNGECGLAEQLTRTGCRQALGCAPVSEGSAVHGDAAHASCIQCTALAAWAFR